MGGFSLSTEHEELRKTLRRFAEEEIAPHAAEADARAEFPRASFDAYVRSGFVRLSYPEEYGGDGGDLLAHALLIEEVARVCASSALFMLISRLALGPILAYGSDELKRRVVTRVASGEWQGSYCLSEAEAGSDVAGMRTRAVRDGDDYVLRGRKSWITNAGVSDFYTVFAKTDPDAGHRGISAFVVERDRPGFSIGKLENKLGVRGSPTGEVVLDDVVVPAENLIGEEGSAFGYAMRALDASRPIVGAQAVGIAQGALDAAAQYVVERRQFDQRIADFQGVQFMLADMATQVEAARLLVYRACSLVDSGAGGTAKASSMAKLFASDAAMRVTTDAVQLFGGAGYTREFPVERMMRDAKATQIYEGTNQIQRVVVARRIVDEVSG
ncbi:MAG TPA: acyl-CoA dehydrogenase family protein [Acidimicrobiia bacterium]|nr:acyl-CoA dehydrogenase family protein [Acidimicrobiia bacterium]